MANPSRSQTLSAYAERLSKKANQCERYIQQIEYLKKQDAAGRKMIAVYYDGMNIRHTAGIAVGFLLAQAETSLRKAEAELRSIGAENPF